MSKRALHVLVLGRGKTGLLVAEVAQERGHRVQNIGTDLNHNGAWLTPQHLSQWDVVIDFTTPHAVLADIAACQRAHKPMVVGTTGWYSEIDRIRKAVDDAGTGFVVGANFSYGVNLFLQAVQAAGPALRHDYRGQITEIHHVHKKDAPSGTAIALQRVLEKAARVRVDITSEREGDVFGAHILELDSGGDRIVLRHEAKSRRIFADGAVRAAEWIVDKTGFYDFNDIFGQV